MNKRNEEILGTLSNNEYQLFLRNALGYKYFINSKYNKNEILIKNKPKNKNTEIKDRKKKNIGYLCSNEEIIDEFYYFDDHYKRKVFISAKEGELNVFSYFSNLEDNIIFFLLIACKERIKYQDIFESDNDVYSITKNINIDTNQFSFILGTGVSSYFNVTRWDDLLDIIKEKLVNEINTDKKLLEKFQNEIGNTNYVLPQIKKDYNRESYFNIIHDGLYKNFDINKIDAKINNDLKNQIIYTIAERLSNQVQRNSKQNVLTFNYDDFLEKIFKHNFSNVSVKSIYKGKKEISEGINIIHSHGFLPEESSNNEHKESIVLSSFEYMDTYEDSNSYGYKTLYSHLDKTNIIIGNSMADYEEQKVFRNHHKLHLSKYHYALFKKSERQWMDIYKARYLFSIGVIPLFFNKFSEMADFLNNRSVYLDE